MEATVAGLLTAWPSARVRAGYVGAVTVFTAVVLLLVNVGVVPLLVAAAVLAVPLGPLGLLLLVLALLGQGVLQILVTGSVDGVTVQQPGLLLADALVLVAVAAVALLNVRIISRVARSEAPNPSGHRGAVPADADRLLAGSVHLYAALGFVLLCFFCGFSALAAHGIDVRVSDAEAQARVLRAGVTWAVGLVAAVAGFVVWIVRSVLGRPLFGWAVGSLTAQAALLGVALLPA